MPINIYNVVKGQRYRFRIIDAASNICSFFVQVEDHQFEVVSSDGSAIKPVTVDTLYIIAGERYDIIVEANKKQVRDYFVRVRALFPCSVETFGILRYHEHEVPKNARTVDFDARKPPIYAEVYPVGKLFNIDTPANLSFPSFAINLATSVWNDQKVVNAEPDFSFKLFMSTPLMDNDVLFSGNNTIKYMGEYI